MPDSALLLALAMVAALTLYALLGGADYGGGVWDLLARGKGARADRDTVAHAIAPVWEANHVWLILVVTVLFAAFPAAFARISIFLHVPISLMLAGIVLRGSAFVFRAYGQMGDRAVAAWGRVFAAASAVTPLLIGAIVGAVTEGRIDPAADGFTAAYMDPWLTPFALSVGGLSLVLFAYLAAVYLTLEGRDQEVVERFRARALITGVLAGVLALIVFLLAERAPHVRSALTASPWAIPLHAATGASAIAALWLLWTRRFWWARAAAATQVALIVWGWALAQYPYLVRPDLSIAASAAPVGVLKVLVVALLAGAVVLIPSLWYLFRVFAPGGNGGRGDGGGGGNGRIHGGPEQTETKRSKEGWN